MKTTPDPISLRLPPDLLKAMDARRKKITKGIIVPRCEFIRYAIRYALAMKA